MMPDHAAQPRCGRFLAITSAAETRVDDEQEDKLQSDRGGGDRWSRAETGDTPTQAEDRPANQPAAIDSGPVRKVKQRVKDRLRHPTLKLDTG